MAPRTRAASTCCAVHTLTRAPLLLTSPLLTRWLRGAQAMTLPPEVGLTMTARMFTTLQLSASFGEMLCPFIMGIAFEMKHYNFFCERLAARAPRPHVVGHAGRAARRPSPVLHHGPCRATRHAPCPHAPLACPLSCLLSSHGCAARAPRRPVGLGGCCSRACSCSFARVGHADVADIGALPHLARVASHHTPPATPSPLSLPVGQ